MSIGGRTMITGEQDGSSCSSKKRRRIKEITSTSSSSYPLLLVLPPDVTCAVLSKLPVKSILRFRSVCKSWEHLISQPYFIELQLMEARRSPPRILVVTNHDPNGRMKFFIPVGSMKFFYCGSMSLYSFEEEEEALEPNPLVAPNPLVEFFVERGHEDKTSVCQYDCDGLVLLMAQTTIWVCNPGTRETLFVHDFSNNMPIDDDVFQHIGFGRDPTTNTYKIVRMFYRSFSYDEEEGEIYEESVGCQVLTIGTTSWRQVDDPPYAPKAAYSASANGGLLYWMTLTDDVLLSFDLKNDKFGVLAPPPAVLSDHQSQCHRRYLMNGHGDTLWFVNVDWDATTTDIWELSTKQLWTKIHSIPHPTTRPAGIILPIPKLVIPNGRCILLCDGQKLQCYDMETKECKKTIFDIHNGKERGGGPVDYYDPGTPTIYSCLYRETLASLKPKTKDYSWLSPMKWPKNYSTDQD